MKSKAVIVSAAALLATGGLVACDHPDLEGEPQTTYEYAPDDANKTEADKAAESTADKPE